jgi:hypothetical protein
MATSQDGAKSIRVSVRLDSNHAAKLKLLQHSTGESVSVLLRRGIGLLYREECGPTQQPFDHLKQCGFIGGWVGPSDLSERYKEALGEDR